MVSRSCRRSRDDDEDLLGRSFRKTSSAIAVGCAFLKTVARMAAILDAYAAAGGTIFDTAPRYGAGVRAWTLKR